MSTFENNHYYYHQSVLDILTKKYIIISLWWIKLLNKNTVMLYYDGIQFIMIKIVMLIIWDIPFVLVFNPQTYLKCYLFRNFKCMKMTWIFSLLSMLIFYRMLTNSKRNTKGNHAIWRDYMASIVIYTMIYRIYMIKK